MKPLYQQTILSRLLERNITISNQFSFINRLVPPVPKIILPIILLLCSIFPNSLAFAEDLILSGNDVMVIENTTYIQTGNIYVKDKAKLTIRNATLIVNIRYHEEYDIIVSDNATLEITNSTIKTPIDGEIQRIILRGASNLIFNGSNLSEGLAYFDFGAEGGSIFSGVATLSNSKIRNISLLFTSQSPSTVIVSDSLCENFTFRFNDNYLGEFANLKPGLFSSWTYTQNNYNILLKNTQIDHFVAACDGPSQIVMRNCEIHQFAPNTSSSDISMTAIDSIIHSVPIGISGVPARYWGLKTGVHNSWHLSDHSIGSTIPELIFENTIILDGWYFKGMSGANVTIDDSIIARLNPMGDSTVMTVANCIIDQLMLYNSINNKLIFDSTTINLIDVYVPPNSTTISGGISFTNGAKINSWYAPSTVKRTFPVTVMGNFGSTLPSANLVLSDKTGKVVWSGQTDAQGKANFDIEFNDTNHNDAWNLVTTFNGRTTTKVITLLTSTPITPSTLNQYAVTPSAGPGGTITPSTVQTVNDGATASFTVTPETGYSASVGGTCATGSLNGTTYTTGAITAPCTVIVTFNVARNYTITASAGPNGIVSPSGVIEVKEGESKTISIIPDLFSLDRVTTNGVLLDGGYRVADVLVDGLSVGAVTSYTFSNINADHTVSANFVSAASSVVAVKYDDFGENSINTTLWHINDPKHIFSQSNGYLHVQSAADATSYNLMAKQNLTGDFDIVLPYKNYQAAVAPFPISGSLLELFLFPTSSDGRLEALVTDYTGAITFGTNCFFNGQYLPNKITNPTAVGSSSGWLRVARIGSTIRTYYRTDGGWIMMGDFPNAFTGEVSWQIRVYTGSNRTFNISSDGVYFINQSTSDNCTYTISPGSAGVAAASALGTVTISPSSSSCSWSATSNASWITVTSGSNGSGNGILNYSVAANSGSTRTATITLAEQTFTITQQASTSAYFDTVQKIYIGYYQRPADPAGLIYWAERVSASNGNLTEIIEAFANSTESRGLYGIINSTSISTIVNDIYNALFARDAEPAGLEYWVGEFNSGRISAASIMLSLLNGAQNEDLQSVNNKLTAANLFTKVIDPDLDGTNFQVTYAGDGDVIAGRNFLSLFATSAKVPAQAETTAYIKTNIADSSDHLLNEFEPLGFPFADVSQARGVGSFAAPNWNSDQPHSGLDVYTYDDRGYDRVNVLSPIGGTVTKIEFQSHPPWHLVAPAIYIQINNEWTVSIVIEPGTDKPLIAEQQRQAVNVEVGQVVAKGDLLGQIVLDPTTETEGGIHMILQKGNRNVCPYSHSSDVAKQIYEQLMSLPGSQPRNGPLCYAEEIP